MTARPGARLNPDRLQTNAEAAKRSYHKHRDARLAATKERQEKIRAEIRTYKVERGCMDCNQKYPSYVLDFDHRNPEEKTFHIAQNGLSKSKKTLWEEIAKCDVVCANCHRIRTHKGKGSDVDEI